MLFLILLKNAPLGNELIIAKPSVFQKRRVDVVNNRTYILFLLAIVALATLAAVSLYWDPACEDLYRIRSATTFEAEGILYGHGEGRIEKSWDWNQKCWDTSWGVGGKLYYASGRWQGELPEVGSRVRIVSPTGLTKNVEITDLTTGRSYLSGYEPQTPKH